MDGLFIYDPDNHFSSNRWYQSVDNGVKFILISAIAVQFSVIE